MEKQDWTNKFAAEFKAKTQCDDKYATQCAEASYAADPDESPSDAVDEEIWAMAASQ